MPRARMSVATIMSILRLLYWNMISSRSPCERSLCISPTLKPCFFSVCEISFTFVLRDAKRMTLSLLSLSKMLLMIPSFCPSWQMYACCVIPSAGFARASVICTGSVKMSRASLRISSGIVAEKSIVWRSLGSCLAIVMMSLQKPMSSIRSASSRMKNDTFDRSMLPRLMWLMSRPGVATIISAPFAMPRSSCS